MAGSATRLLAGFLLATGLIVSPQVARGDSPPLKTIEPDAYTDQPAGVKYGGLLYHASLMTGHIWDSNIFSSKQNIVADRILYVRPGITVSTLDPNYNFVFRTSFDVLEYERSPAEDRADPKADLQGTIRLQRDLEALVGFSAARINEPRSITRRDLPEDAATPIPHNLYSARVGFRVLRNPLTSTTTFSYENDNYQNVRSNSGTTINLQQLDRDVLKVSHEEELKLSQRLLLFSRQRVIASDYREVVGQLQRDSTKYEVVSGIEVGFTPLIKGKFEFHFAEEHFTAATVDAEPEQVYTTELSWSPRRNLRLKASFARDFGGVNFDLDAAGGRRTRTDLVIEYDITRQLFFRSTLAYKHANEAGITTGTNRVEDTYQMRNSLGYELNRFWSVFLDYAYERRDALNADDEFKRHVIQAGAVARF